jgi:dihydrofolate reductase
MKKTLFLATTIDGLIAKEDDQVTWSQDVWRNYYEYCSNVGYLMVGRRTFELMHAVGEADNINLKKFIIISSQTKPVGMPGDWFTSHLAAFEFLEREGCLHVVVGGGRTLANTLLSENLIDEIQLDIEPKIYGAGVPLFGKIDAEYDLKLIETFQSGANTVRVCYSVIGKAG